MILVLICNINYKLTFMLMIQRLKKYEGIKSSLEMNRVKITI